MPDLNSIIQRMIDAGESEENIALVIRESKAGASAPRVGLGQAKVDVARGPVDDSGATPSWFETELRPMLEKVANPKTISDIAGLLIPAGYGAPLAAGVAKAGSAMRSIPIRKPLAGALDIGSAILDNPVVGVVSPRGQQGGRLLSRAADFVRGEAPGAVSAPGYPRLTIREAAPAAAEVVEATAPAAAKAAPYQPNVALKAAKDAFGAIGEAPLKAEASNAMELIRRGKTPDEAIRIVMGNRPVPATPTKMAEAVNALPGNLKLTSEEVRVGLKLLERGKSPSEALEAILAQRALSKMPGVQSTATVTQRVADRNATGRWP